MSQTPQQKRASEIRTNCVVSAGAGSGKTGVLSQRFENLVKDNLAHCNEILTITYTRKATSEMKDRIYKKIVELNRPEELALFSDCSISTVDGFCAKIARTDCESYGITPDFTVLDAEDYSSLLVSKATSFINSRLEDLCIKTLLERLSPAAVAKLLADTEDGFLNIVSHYDYQAQTENYISFAMAKSSQCNEKLITLAKDYVDSLNNEVLLSDNVKMLKNFLDGKITAQQIEFNSKQGSKAVSDFAKELKGRIKAFKEDWIFYTKAADNKDFIYSFYSLMKDYHEEVNSFKRKNSCLVFSDVLALSLEILKTNRSIRDYFKHKYRYIMIDEFQDNNDDYRKLIYYLAEKADCFTQNPTIRDIDETKIFLVGDQKQSIYRFRGADVSVFKRMENEITLSGGELIELDKNFRSTPALVTFFNKVFSKIMTPCSLDFEASFKELDYDTSKEQKSRIVFHEYIHSNEDNDSNPELASVVQSEAYSIASLVERMIETDEFLINGNRPEPKDIAILFRQSTNQGAFEKALRLKNIHYSIKTTRALTQEALVNDFYNALQLCIYPDDLLTKEAFENSPLNQSLEQLKDIVNKGSISDSVSFIWNTMGYRNFIISNPANAVYQEHYLWLLALADKFDTDSKTIVEFLDYLRHLLGSAKKIRELNVQTEDSDGVQLMTIHASKGLQFPIVILVSMEAGEPTVKEELKTSSDGKNIYLPCSLTSDSSFRNVYDHANLGLEAKMEDAELKRLFYVALTRAQNHLVLSTGANTSKLKEKNDEKVRKSNLAKLFLDAFPLDSLESLGMEVIHFDRIEEENTYSSRRLTKGLLETVKPYYRAQDDSFVYTKDHVAVTELEVQKEEDFETLPSIPSDDIIREYKLQTEFGTLVHSFMECGIKHTEPKPYLNEKLTPEALKMLVSDAKELSEKFLDSTLFNSVKDKELHSERAFMLYDEESHRMVEGIIDLYAVDQETVYLFDFKTDLYKNENAHKIQLDWYSKALQALYPDKKIQACIVYLRDL